MHKNTVKTIGQALLIIALFPLFTNTLAQTDAFGLHTDAITKKDAYLSEYPCNSNENYLNHHNNHYKNDSLKSISTFIKNINEFERIEEKTKGSEEGGIYVLKNGDSSKYLIKFMNKEDVIYDFVSSFILRKIIGDRAPLNYILKIDSEQLAIGSKFIENFVSVYDYTTSTSTKYKEINKLLDKGCYGYLMENTYNLPQRCITNNKPLKDLYYSDKTVESNLLANFINQTDHSRSNKGYIIKDGKIIASALIDFNFSLLTKDDGQLPPNYYYNDIEAALRSLKLISLFDINSLNELEQLFDQLNKKQLLVDIKNFMLNKLININMQIKICNLVKQALAKGSFTDEAFNQLIKHPDILTNFTLENGENTTVNLLCIKNEVSRLVNILLVQKNLIPNLVKYCFNHDQHKLLDTVISQLQDPIIIDELVYWIIMQPQTAEHLQLAANLIEKIPNYSEHYNLIKYVLNSTIDANKLNYVNTRVDINKPISCYNREFIYFKHLNVNANNNNDTIKYKIAELLTKKLIIICLYKNNEILMGCNFFIGYDDYFIFDLYDSVSRKGDRDTLLDLIIDIIIQNSHHFNLASQLVSRLIWCAEFEDLDKILRNIPDKDKINIRNNFDHFCSSYRCENDPTFKNNLYKSISHSKES